jgi:short-subunit dehydrogenase
LSTPGIRGKTALVTGASSGLGRDIARDLARRGANLIVVARRKERLEEVRDELEAAHHIAVTVVPADLAAPGAADQLHARVKELALPVDILVNNAGLGVRGEFLDVPWDQHESLLKVDVMAPLRLAHLFVPEMVERGWGRVLFIASNMAYQASPGFATYGASKGFILLFGEALAFELRKTGVRVSTVSPGMTHTEFHQVAGVRPSVFQRLVAMPSERVAAESVKAMLKGTPSTVIGLQNKAMEYAGRVTPRRLATWSSGKITQSPSD